jgi:hypothetical protein
MKALMIEAVNKTHSFLWVLFREDIGPSLLADFGLVDPVDYWNEPEFDPKFAIGLTGMMRVFAAGATPRQTKKKGNARRQAQNPRGAEKEHGGGEQEKQTLNRISNSVQVRESTK